MTSDTNAGAFGPWLSPSQAWQYLGFGSRKGLYRAIARGQLPVHRLGRRRLRFSKPELDAFLAAAPTWQR